MKRLGNRSTLLATLAILLSSWLLPSPAIAHEGDHEGGEVMVIAAVVPDSAADKAGLQEGDKILEWDGLEISTQTQFEGFLASQVPGETIQLLIERDGETLELPFTFGRNAEGGVSLGVSIGVASQQGDPPGDSEKITGEECLAWIDDTYRMAEMAEEFGLDLSAQIAEIRVCTNNDLVRMPETIPQGWCDNVFKIHCSGVDLIAEIGDAQVARCATQLSDSLSTDITRNQIWNTCGEEKVFDRYSLGGEASDEATCRSILLDECGADIDRAGQSGGDR